jgi:hypothetical protein
MRGKLAWPIQVRRTGLGVVSLDFFHDFQKHGRRLSIKYRMICSDDPVVY